MQSSRMTSSGLIKEWIERKLIDLCRQEKMSILNKLSKFYLIIFKKINYSIHIYIEYLQYYGRLRMFVLETMAFVYCIYCSVFNSNVYVLIFIASLQQTTLTIYSCEKREEPFTTDTQWTGLNYILQPSLAKQH